MRVIILFSLNLLFRLLLLWCFDRDDRVGHLHICKCQVDCPLVLRDQVTRIGHISEPLIDGLVLLVNEFQETELCLVFEMI